MTEINNMVALPLEVLYNYNMDEYECTVYTKHGGRKVYLDWYTNSNEARYETAKKYQSDHPSLKVEDILRMVRVRVLRKW